MKLQLAVNIAKNRVERIEEQVILGAPANLNNVDFKGAHHSFEKAGYKNTDKCRTIFV